MSLPGTKLRSLPGSVSPVGELGLPASLGSAWDPWQGHVPLSGRAEKVLGKAHLNKERCLTGLSQTMLHPPTQNPWQGQCKHCACGLWAQWHLVPSSWQRFWTWCSASAACLAGTKPLTCSKGCRAEWGCGCCSLLTNQSSSGQGGIAQTPGWEGGSWLLGQEEVGRVGVAEQRSAGNISLNACPSLLPAGICGEQPCGTWCRSAAAATLRVPAWRLGAHDCLPLSIHSLMFPVSLSRNNLTSGKRNQRWPQLLCVLCKQPHLAEQPSPSARTDNTLLSGRWLPRG